MTLAHWLTTWRGLTAENRFHRFALAALVTSNLLTGVALLRAERTVVLVPPVLDGPVSVARESASQEVREAWALHVAGLLGNVSPGNAAFLQRALEPLLDPSLRRPLIEVMARQVEDIQRENVTSTFMARDTRFEPATGKVFVSGQQTTSGPGGKPQVRPRTYELRVEFRAYRPVVTHLDVYPGEPRTLDRLPPESEEASR